MAFVPQDSEDIRFAKKAGDRPSGVQAKGAVHAVLFVLAVLTKVEGRKWKRWHPNDALMRWSMLK